MSRREKLESMLSENPGDVFLRYALAMELANEGDAQGCQRLFADLMNETPPYVPAFFMSGQNFAAQGQIESAREVLRKGIEVAREQGDHHAAAEMSEFLQSLGSLGE